ncbi:MAG TPA: transketolase [Candidatus Binataceae bacterium]|nr:transketolase [Candidatus Binataceae bacterium]
MEQSQLDQLCINTIRTLSIDMVQKANSGHPGLPMGMAPTAYVLFSRFLRFNPKDPKWCGRDRFVLSAGHGSALLYSLLHLYGYDLPLDQIKRFRQLESMTPGHPENFKTPGVETTTGPLGQGFGTGVGMAIAAKHLEARFERDNSGLFNQKIFAIVSDGDLMEGISHEAASIAGHLGLGNIIYLYDDNHVTLDGPAPLSFSEDVNRRFEGYHWHTQSVEDGNDIQALEKAIRNAIDEKERPSIVRIRTIIGYGAPHQGTSEVHGKALGPEGVKAAKKFYGWPLEPDFFIPAEAKAEFDKSTAKGKQLQDDWSRRYDTYSKKYQSESKELNGLLSGELPVGWDSDLPVFTTKDNLATRKSASIVEQAILKKMWGLFGGSADLSESTFTDMEGDKEFEKGNYAGRNIKFGVREHGMCAALNGIAHNGAFIPYGSSFFCFTDYARGSIRLGCLMKTHVIWIFTHDSIGLGEDGPTHQGVEHLTALRAIPNITVIRPGDANEAREAWRAAILHRDGPTMMVLSRQNVPTLDRADMAPATDLHKGGYILSETKGKTPDVILIATGGELHFAVEAKPELEKKGHAVRVVSMPSMEIFDRQPQSYRDSVLPPNNWKRLGIEAGSPMSWYKYLGPNGDMIGMTTFGESAPYKDLAPHFGFTVENVVKRAEKLIAGK